MLWLKKMRGWFVKSMHEPPTEEYADYLGFILFALSLLLLFYGFYLFDLELTYIRKFSGFSSRWQALHSRPDRLLLFSPTLVWLVLALRKLCRGRRAYYVGMLAALLILIFSAIFIALDGAAFSDFYETLP